MHLIKPSSNGGSVLPKITFVLVLFIAAAAGYLVVRERLRAGAERERAAAAARLAEQEAEIFQAVAKYTSNSAKAQPQFAPLRDRVATNTVRVPSNRFVAVQQGADVSPPVVVVGESRPNPRNNVELTPTAPAPLTAGGIAARGGARSITGRVLLRGTPPPEKVVTMDAACAAIQPKRITTRHYVVGKDGGLADVFVYVKQGIAPTAAPEPEPSPLLDQVGCEYLPYVIGVQTGHTLLVRNSDAMMHNIHVVSRAGNKERNIAQPVKGMTTRLTFDKPEVFVQFKCDVHPWMFAYVGVAEHPWFAVTDGQGNFALPGGLPAGEYTLAAVHRKAGEQSQAVAVDADGTGAVTFTLDVPAP